MQCKLPYQLKKKGWSSCGRAEKLAMHQFLSNSAFRIFGIHSDRPQIQTYIYEVPLPPKFKGLIFKMEALFFKMEALFFKMEALFFKMEALFFKVEALVFKMEALFFKMEALFFKMEAFSKMEVLFFEMEALF